MKPTETFDDTFWAYNVPIQLYRTKREELSQEEIDELLDEHKESLEKLGYYISYHGYAPRKDRVWENELPIPPEEIEDVIDNTIEKFETALAILKSFKAGKQDVFYYWDKDQIIE